MPGLQSTKRRTRIGLSHWYSADNLGDFAIAGAQLELLRSDKHIDLAVIGVEERVTFPEELAQYQTVCSPWSSPGTAGMTGWLLGLISAVVTLVMPHSKLLPKEYRDFARFIQGLDVLMPKGGGYLYARSGINGLLFTLRICWPLLLARRLRVRRVLWGHSIGPAESRLGGAVLRVALRGADIAVRDSASARLLKAWKFSYRRKPDLAFRWGRIPSDYPTRARDSSAEVVLGVTALTVGGAKRQAAYEGAIVRAVTNVAAAAAVEGASVTVALLPQVIGPTKIEDDRPILERLATRFPVQSFVENLSHAAVEDALFRYSKLDFLLATRLHSAILASCAGVPFVVLEYIGGKAGGAIEDLQLPRWVRATDFEQLVSAAERGWRARRHLRDRIRKTVPALAKELETLQVATK